MDIIVTTPKDESENSAREAEMCIKDGGGYYVRTFKRKPKVEVGERVYYVEDGYVCGFATVHSLMGDEFNLPVFVCGYTKKDREGYQVAMDAKSWKWIRPIPCKGFQGFRYAKLKNVRVIGGWLDPKPELEMAA